MKLVVCTHAHADHYGLAGPILDAAGCELWIHPAWDHVRRFVEDPEGSLHQRIEVARQSGVPAEALERYEKTRKGESPTIERLVPPDRELVPGVEVPTDLGPWQVYETPGHAPSHVCLHQPDRRLLISGDHLLGRISLFYDYGHMPDPVGEYLGGLDEISGLDVDLCLSGHGRPFRDVQAKIEATRTEATDQLDRVRDSILRRAEDGLRDDPRPGRARNLNPATAAWGLQIALAYLDHLGRRRGRELRGGRQEGLADRRLSGWPRPSPSRAAARRAGSFPAPRRPSRPSASRSACRAGGRPSPSAASRCP